MNVIPFEAYTHRATNTVRDFIEDYGQDLASLLAFVAGETGLDAFEDAISALEGVEADVPSLCDAIDRMAAIFVEACRPGSSWNAAFLSLGGRLTELRYAL